MNARLAFDAAFDLRPNAYAPLAPWAEPMLAARFAEFGRGPFEFDCMGVVEFVQAKLQRTVRDYRACYEASTVGDANQVDQIIAAEMSAWRAVDEGNVGDVLVCGSGRRAHHVAVLCGAGRAVHAMRGAGVKIEAIEGKRAVTRFAGLRIYGVFTPA